MTTQRNPRQNFKLASAIAEVQNTPQRVLVVGPQLATGTAVSGQLNQQILNDGSEDTLFGQKSLLAFAVRDYKRINQVSRVDAIGFDDDGGASKASSDTVFAGTATADADITVQVVSARYHSYPINVLIGETAAQIAAKVEAAIDLDGDVPVVASLATATVTCECQNGGTEGNTLSIRVIGAIPGVTITIGAFAGGASNPSITNLFDVIAGQRYQGIVFPATWVLTQLTDLLDDRFNVDNAILDGEGFISITGDFATVLAAGSAENSPLTIFGFRDAVNDVQFQGSSLLHYSLGVSAQFAGARARRLTDGADTTDLLSGDVGFDGRGGAALASRPYFNTPLKLPIEDTGQGWTDQEVKDLTSAGVSTMGNNIANNGYITGAVKTTITTDAAGNPDTTFSFLNYFDTASGIREYMFNNNAVDAAQKRLTDGDLVEGRPMDNEDSIIARFVGYFQTLSGPDFALTQAGTAASDVFKQNIDINLDLDVGLVQMVFNRVPIVVQAREFDVTFKISFNLDQ
jgi:hypothetical protein